ncbi:MAG: hypothetical protein L6Q81_17180 [Bacteroidia bacterium]|nr:hypothetical protein [Bacteroidia bacterium]
MSLKHELQNIIGGNGSVRYGELIQATCAHLRREKGAISEAKKRELSKKEEEKILIDYISKNGLWFNEKYLNGFIGEGAEQKIYESENPEFILKTNDSIFYSYWEEYFHSILIHNCFFPHLAYELLGFILKSETLYAVVKQAFVLSTEPTNLENVKDFLLANGFVNTRNNDYHHPDLGLILEDLHDENVLTSNGSLQFIDTVFYLTPQFYNS